MRCIAKNIYYRELVEMLIQAKKESVTGIITGFKDYISQSGIANLNGVQYLLRVQPTFRKNLPVSASLRKDAFYSS
ncbi:unnamed protein product [Rhizophagus irregularis]|nr:unnamed protein product [Rhizophagus irregularis]